MLILHEQGPPPPHFIAQHADQYNDLPFDGVTTIGYWSDQVMQSVRLSEDNVRTELSVFGTADLSCCRDNWLVVYATPFGTFDKWQVPAANFGILASAVQAIPNLVGIKFDIEEYYGNTWDPTGHVRTGGEQPSDKQRDLAYEWGRQVMLAMVKRAPRIKVMVTLGAYVSSSEAWGRLAKVTEWPVNDVAWANPYQGDVIRGMVSATVGTKATLIDGGELYYMPDRTARLEWKQYMAGSHRWTHRQGWGVYDWPGDTSEQWTPRGPWGSWLLNKDCADALETADGGAPVWFYTERYRFCENPNSDKPAPPDDVMRALRDAHLYQ